MTCDWSGERVPNELGSSRPGASVGRRCATFARLCSSRSSTMRPACRSPRGAYPAFGILLSPIISAAANALSSVSPSAVRCGCRRRDRLRSAARPGRFRVGLRVFAKTGCPERVSNLAVEKPGKGRTLQWTCPNRVLAMLLLLVMVTLGAAPTWAAEAQLRRGSDLGVSGHVSDSYCGDHAPGFGQAAHCGSACCATLILPASVIEVSFRRFIPGRKPASQEGGLAPEVTPPPPKGPHCEQRTPARIRGGS